MAFETKASEVDATNPYAGETIQVGGTDTGDMSTDFNSASWNVSTYRFGSLQASWVNIDATNSTMILEGSDDDTGWAELGGDEGGRVILDTVDAVQVWEFKEFTVRFVRLAYKANNVSAGTVTIKGYGKS